MGEFEVYQVKSTQITQIGYDVVTQKLTVWFNSGSAYDYYEVPEKLWEQFKNAPSKGIYLNEHIKGHYTYKKI